MFFVSLRRGSEINGTWLITRLANQRAKNTIYLCAIYSGSSPPAKSPLAFWTWNPGLNSTSPRLIDIFDPNCLLFQRKPLLCLLLPSPPPSKCCATLSTYRVARNVGGSLIFFWSGYFAFVLFIIIVIIIINIIIIIIIVIIIIIIILLKLISAVVKDWFFSVGTIYFCVFQEVVFNWNFRVNLHVEIQVKNKKIKKIKIKIETELAIWELPQSSVSKRG